MLSQNTEQCSSWFSGATSCQKASELNFGASHRCRCGSQNTDFNHLTYIEWFVCIGSSGIPHPSLQMLAVTGLKQTFVTQACGEKSKTAAWITVHKPVCSCLASRQECFLQEHVSDSFSKDAHFKKAGQPSGQREIKLLSQQAANTILLPSIL